MTLLKSAAIKYVSAGMRFPRGALERVSELQTMRELQPNFKTPNSRTEMVDIVRLDEELPRLLPDWRGRRVYLKMDTQGYDLEVFRGAQGILGSVVGLQSELSVQPLYAGMPHYIDALATYEGAGYDLHNLSVVGRAEDGSVIELNCYMRRREGRA